MTELDKIALEVADTIPTVAEYDWDGDAVKEFARRLVAKLSEGQKPVGYFQHIDGLDSTVCHDGYWEEVFPNTEGCVPLFSSPPLTADTRTLDVLRQALNALQHAQPFSVGPLSAKVHLDAIANLRALITELENKA